MATCRTVYLPDQDFVDLVNSLRASSTVAYFTQADGSIKLYADDGTGTKLDVVIFKKKSLQPYPS